MESNLVKIVPPPNPSQPAQTGVDTGVNRPTHSFLIKTIAVLAFTILALAAVSGFIGAGITMFDDELTSTGNIYKSSIVAGRVNGYNRLAGRAYFSARGADGSIDTTTLTKELFDYTGETNYRCVISDPESGRTLFSNISGQSVQQAGWESSYGVQHVGDVHIQGYLLNPLVVNDDNAKTLRFVSTLYRYQNALLTICVVSCVLALLVFVFLMCAAGRRRDSLTPQRSFIDRIPFDLLLFAGGGLLTLILYIGANTISSDRFILQPSLLAVWMLLPAVCILICLELCMTFAVRVKTHTFWRNNICIYILTFFFRAIRGVFRWFKSLIVNLPILWKGIAGFFGIGLLLLLTFVGGQNGNAFSALLCIAAIMGLFVLVIAALKQMNRLKQGGAALAKGELSKQIETKGMFPEFKTHAEHLNSAAAGMNLAVSERMKSERLKTDLIANVSHDLKTPLTNIVSYVDLLKKEELHNDVATGYVEVLDRQSARLKKLTEDLVEASKASSGVLKVNLTSTDVTEILDQSLAEYHDRMVQAQLHPIISKPTGPLMVQADGRLLWRVFDNLLSNIVKYAMPGTRVYIDAFLREPTVSVTFKNISRDALNISASELTERFVRGDASRNSEGSGLGLSIAQSLAELQGAKFDVQISGDLFTVGIILPVSPFSQAAAGFTAGLNGTQPAQTNPGGETTMDVETQRDSQPFATNLLTQLDKTEESIEAAKEHVDTNEK